MFIVFEGIDGSGKSTQARLLSDFFESQGIPFILTHEPSDGIIGQKLRSLASRLKPEAKNKWMYRLTVFLGNRVRSPIESLLTPWAYSLIMLRTLLILIKLLHMINKIGKPNITQSCH